MKKIIKVVGGIIIENNKVLCALRSLDMSLPNYWEFPGGKVEKGESIQETIEREIKEELGCLVKASKHIYNTNTYEYEKFIIELTTIFCNIVEGRPKASEHEELLWLDRRYLKSLSWAPADIPVIELLVENKIKE